MKLLVDMNLSPLWIPFLNQYGFEAIDPVQFRIRMLPI